MLNIRAFDQLAKPRTLRSGIAGKIEHDEIPFDKRAQTCGVSAFFSREEHFTNSAQAVDATDDEALNVILPPLRDALKSLRLMVAEYPFRKDVAAD